ncbi:MAG: GGDEF domain-containing protein [Burkholderiales bacterium]|nr:MAG: GGDEF domain-containing protein [Burkholderiales bacterium]
MTVTVAQTLTLLVGVILVAAVGTVVWLAMALVARIAPRASFAMASANAAAAASLTLHALRGVLPDAFTYWPGDVLAIASFALLAAAVSDITSRQFTWRAGSSTVVTAAVLLFLLPYEGDLRWQARIVGLASAGLMLMSGLQARRALSGRRDGRLSPLLLPLPLLLIALLLGARAVETVINPGRTPDMRVPTEFNLLFLWGALVLTLLQNATLAFLVLMRLILRIEKLLERDPLTGTLNRRAFDRALEEAHAGFVRGRGYALVMIDMDRFKHLNDTLGHAAGDAALRQMVAELRPCVREVDRFGRLGGEEFGLLLPDTDLAGAALVAERMRMLVDSAPLRWLEQDWPLSASFGIAEAERGDTSASAVLARADAALYRAKGQGRNVVQA